MLSAFSTLIPQTTIVEPSCKMGDVHVFGVLAATLRLSTWGSGKPSLGQLALQP